MSSEKAIKQYVAFLRGINVGGHHKVPMADLKKELAGLGYSNIVTILNSGNVIFSAAEESPEKLEETISAHLESTFGFPVPTLIRDAESIQALHAKAPFENEVVTKDIRLYISFLREDTQAKLSVPWASEDQSLRILAIENRYLLSVLDLSVTKTPDAMGIIEKLYGKGITTRNWKTIDRIINKL